MKYRPHEYQQYAIEYIETHPVSAVLLDMGLGKTSITLTALQDLLFDRFEAHKVLIVAPDDTCGVDTLKKDKAALQKLFEKGYGDGARIASFLK